MLKGVILLQGTLQEVMRIDELRLPLIPGLVGKRRGRGGRGGGPKSTAASSFVAEGCRRRCDEGERCEEVHRRREEYLRYFRLQWRHQREEEGERWWRTLAVLPCMAFGRGERPGKRIKMKYFRLGCATNVISGA